MGGERSFINKIRLLFRKVRGFRAVPQRGKGAISLGKEEY